MCGVLFDINHKDLLIIKQKNLVRADWQSTLLLTNLPYTDNFYSYLVLFTAGTSLTFCRGPGPCTCEKSSKHLEASHLSIFPFLMITTYLHLVLTHSFKKYKKKKYFLKICFL